jgi:hypothetical protein
MARHCTKCGHELRDTDNCCAECGTASGASLPTHLVSSYTGRSAL